MNLGNQRLSINLTSLMSGGSFQGGSLLMTSNWYWNWRLQRWMGRFGVFVRRRICHRWKAVSQMKNRLCYGWKTMSHMKNRQCHGWKTDNVTDEKQTISRMKKKATVDRMAPAHQSITANATVQHVLHFSQDAKFVPRCNKILVVIKA